MALPINVTIIEEADRSTDGVYEIGTGQIQVFPFEIEAGGQLRVPILQFRFRQALSIRVWVSRGKPFGSEIFFRFHPGTGGITHIFFDKDLDPVPIPKESAIQRNEFSGIISQFKDILVPVIPDEYFYNVQNLESSPANSLNNTPNSYKVGFLGPEPICD